MSAEFDRFLKSNFFSKPFDAWHDGLDVPKLTALHGDELAKAESMLLKMLPDSRAIDGLGAIRSEKAVEPLRKLLHNASVSTNAAAALVAIQGDTSGVDTVIATLKNRQLFWSERMDAAIALRNFRSEKAVNALLDALDDPEGLVRYHSAQSLLILYGQMDVYAPITTLPPYVSIRIMREPDRAEAVEVLRKMVKEGKLDGT